MKVGDSFFWEVYTREEMQKVCNAGRAYILYMRSNEGLRVCAKKEGKGFRVWMIKKDLL